MAETHRNTKSSDRVSDSTLLVIQPMVGIGDMVWHKPWLDAMVESRKVTLMAKPSAQAEAVMAEHDGLSILPLHRAERGKKGQHDGVLGFFRMVKAIRCAGADEVYILHRSWRYGAATWLAGIRQRSGYGLGAQGFYLNHFKGLPKSLEGAHPREAVARFSKNLGIHIKDNHPHIRVSDAEVRKAAKFVGDERPLIILGVGAADAERRWSPGRFAALLDLMAETHGGHRFALCGSPAEAPLGDAVVEAIGKNTPPPLLVFDQTVRKVIALHRHAVLYIGNDTSLINIAAAVDTPAIRVFASNLPVLDSPLIETVLPRDKSRIGMPDGIDDIHAEQIAEIARQRLDSVAQN